MNKLGLAAGLLLIGTLPLAASAHTSVSVGIGIPIYAAPPPVYYEPEVIDYEYYEAPRVYRPYYGYYGYYGTRYYAPRVIYRDDDGPRRWHHRDRDEWRGEWRGRHEGHEHHH